MGNELLVSRVNVLCLIRPLAILCSIFLFCSPHDLPLLHLHTDTRQNEKLTHYSLGETLLCIAAVITAAMHNRAAHIGKQNKGGSF